MSTSQETNENLLAFCNGQKFATIYADPPWRFQNRTGKVAPEHKRLNRYDTMDLEAIKAMPVEEIAAEKSHLYLWVPNALLPDGLEVMKAWGFTYRDPLVWNKTNVGLGLGNYLRNGCEIVLFGTRGRAPVKFKGQSNLLFAPRQDHSHKPEEFFAIVERLYDGPYLELFARRHPSSNKDWSVWGNEIESDIFIPGYPVPEYSDKAKESEEV